MSYDHWKTTNPADEFLGPEPTRSDEEIEADDFSLWLWGIVMDTLDIDIEQFTDEQSKKFERAISSAINEAREDGYADSLRDTEMLLATFINRTKMRNRT